MPEMRDYKVTQVREVEVTATSATDAILIAQAAFEHGQDTSNGVARGKGPDDVWGNTTKKIVERSLHTDRIR